MRQMRSDFREKFDSPRVKQILHRVIVLYVHPKIAVMFDHSRLGLENKFFPNKVADHLNFIRLMHSLSNHSVLETMDNWTVPKYNFIRHTI